ncbi:MAG: hypothetical protein WC967_12720 [Balneolaceae bacterium]
MDYETKQQIVSRIIIGKSILDVKNPLTGENIEVVVSDPRPNIIALSTVIYKKALKQAISTGIMPRLELEKNLVSIGVLEPETKVKIKEIESEIGNLKSQMRSARFKVALQKQLAAKIDNLTKEHTKLINLRESVLSCSAEDQAQLEQQNYIIKCSIHMSDNTAVPEELLNNECFIGNVLTLFQDDLNLSVSDYREIARSEPWRTYWHISKSGNMPLFPVSAVEITNHQRNLCSWSRFYDAVYESHERPPEYVIEDDDLLDEWFETKGEEVKKHSEKTYRGSGKIGSGGTGYRFYMADEEGAQKVYALNDDNTRAEIIKRQEVIKNKGIAKETDMPDVKKNLRIAVNELNRQAVKNRRNK